MYAIAGLIAEKDLQPDYVIPDPFDRRVVAHVAAAVVQTVMETGDSQKMLIHSK